LHFKFYTILFTLKEIVRTHMEVNEIIYKSLRYWEKLGNSSRIIRYKIVTEFPKFLL